MGICLPRADGIVKRDDREFHGKFDPLSFKRPQRDNYYTVTQCFEEIIKSVPAWLYSVPVVDWLSPPPLLHSTILPAAKVEQPSGTTYNRMNG